MHYAGTVDSASEPMIRLAAKIASLAPGRLNKVAFASGGSEAVETALKLAKQFQQQSGRQATRLQDDQPMERLSRLDHGRPGRH